MISPFQLASASGPPLVLASASQTRLTMLRAAGVTCTAVPATVDEEAMRDALAAEEVATGDAAVILAELKGRQVAAGLPPETIVLACDSLLELKGRWLAKPADRAAARTQLIELRGQRHSIVSAVVGFRHGTRVWHAIGRTELQMRPFSDAFLEEYLNHAGPELTTSVGAYALEGLGAQLFSRVDGDWFNVLGLPLLPTLQFLRDQGLLTP